MSSSRRSLPPLFTTEGEQSFARRSIRDRHAATLLEVIEACAVLEPHRSRLLEFRTECLGGELTDPFREPAWSWDPGLFAPGELADWREALGPLVGRSWYELPWYFAESFWFLRLLLAFGYYEPAGANRLRDPFLPFKRRELEPGLQAAAGLLAPGAPEEEVRELLLASVWGNRMDLSMRTVAHEYRGELLRSHELLIDHSRETARLLCRAQRVDVILDNAGPELVCDLLLASRLLAGAPAGGGPAQVVLHAKRSPFYVSDARPADVREAIQALSQAPDPPLRAAGGLLGRRLEEGRLRVLDHWFWNGPRFFQDLPADLRAELERADLTLIKGDANYRRLVGDRRWPHATPMEPLTGYFPSALAALRTMKSEVAVDLPEALVRRLQREDPERRTNGRRGLVRLVSS